MYLFFKKRKFKRIHVDTSIGRSMIEMLAVLALVGLLSFAAIEAYKKALLKYTSNETINELNMRALSISALLSASNNPDAFIPGASINDGFPETTALGFPISSYLSPMNKDYFEVVLDSLEPALCRQILRDYITPVLIYVGNDLFNQDLSLCNTSPLAPELTFIYRNDLATLSKCSDKGYFDANDLQCHCSGNTYIDPFSNECLCPSGHIWSESEKTCVESICAEGYFESLSNGCVPCDDAKNYTISSNEAQIKVCNACPNREYNGYVSTNPLCVRKCAENEFMSRYGTCFSCDSTNRPAPVTNEECAKCPNRTNVDGWFCILNTFCDGLGQNHPGTYFLADSTTGYVRTCTLCSSSQDKIHISGSGTHSAALCNACRQEGVQSRKVIGNYCVKTLCSTNEFKGADEGCYSCSEITPIFVGTDETLQKGCQTCPNRYVTEAGYCQISDCEKGSGVRLDNGSCYSCTYSGWGNHITVKSEAEKESCEACPNRIVVGSYCIYPDACDETNFIDSSDYCRSCSNTQAYPVGSSSYLQNRCLSCPAPNTRHLTSAHFCVSDHACTSTQFLTERGVCVACAVTNKIFIGSNTSERQRCQACTSELRFWSGNYCYRCDSAETPSVSTEEEISSCLRCKNRSVQDGQCVLNQ